MTYTDAAQHDIRNSYEQNLSHTNPMFSLRQRSRKEPSAALANTAAEEVTNHVRDGHSQLRCCRRDNAQYVEGAVVAAPPVLAGAAGDCTAGATPVVVGGRLASLMVAGRAASCATKHRKFMTHAA